MPLLFVFALFFCNNNNNNMVNLHGSTSVSLVGLRAVQRNIHSADIRPPDPQTLLSALQLEECVEQLHEWISTKSSILTITGAGLSTESGIPDYRGSKGSYHEGHKPMIHDQFMSAEANRKRYWGRGMVGWTSFDQRLPNAGHEALSTLETLGKIGVVFDDLPDYHGTNDERYLFGNGQQQLSIITQNVDNLHQRAGTKHVTELHGRTSRLKCMNCGSYESRNVFTEQLESWNQKWLQDALVEHESQDLRPDGDAQLATQNFHDIVIPACKSCSTGFLKPDVVFFGDSVPKHRVERCKAAVQASDGLLCIGTSLAVHSAFRFAKLAASLGTEICILNVGETRAEKEGTSGVTKIEAPIGSTLTALVERMQQEQQVLKF